VARRGAARCDDGMLSDDATDIHRTNMFYRITIDGNTSRYASRRTTARISDFSYHRHGKIVIIYVSIIFIKNRNEIESLLKRKEKINKKLKIC
jgi:hypothetical protein